MLQPACPSGIHYTSWWHHSPRLSMLSTLPPILILFELLLKTCLITDQLYLTCLISMLLPTVWVWVRKKKLFDPVKMRWFNPLPAYILQWSSKKPAGPGSTETEAIRYLSDNWSNLAISHSTLDNTELIMVLLFDTYVYCNITMP